MNNREKIILTLTFLVAIYAVVDFLVFSNKNRKQTLQDKAAQALSGAKDFASQSMGKIAKLELKFKQTDWQGLTKKIETPWEKDPFLQPAKPKAAAGQGAAPEATKKIDAVYTGYMQLGDKSFAIINGLEYREGNELIELGYKVVTINPKSVVLEKGPHRIEIQLSED